MAYEAVNSDMARRASSDQTTLTGRESDELAFSPTELAFEDPLDEKDQYQSYAKQNFKGSLMQGWTRLQSVVVSLVSRSHSRPQRRTSVGVDGMEDEASRGLMMENGSSPRWATVATTAVSTTRYWLVWPLPSYVHHFFLPDSGETEVYRPTDYLDGLRGVASLFVFFDHLLVGSPNTDMVEYGFGEGNNWNFLQLPFIRTFYSGSAMVSIFFVISGYVLSQRCIVAMRTKKPEKVYNILTSTTFRRGMRLFLPSVAASICGLIACIFKILPRQHPKHWTLRREMHLFVNYLNDFIFKLWAWDISWDGYYAPQLWTIPLEFKCSMCLFLQILIVARCTPRVRFAVQIMTLFYLFYADRWDVATFVAGMLIAEVNVISDESEKKAEEARGANQLASQSLLQKTRNCMHAFVIQMPLWIILILGWYLSGYPGSDAQHTPGYHWLTHFWKADFEYKFRFWLAQSAILIVFATSYLRPAKSFFTTSIARYLGKISYALYLVHSLLNRTVRYWLWHLFWKILNYTPGSGDVNKLEGGFWMGVVLYVPMVLWVADIFWRAVDVPTVKFAKWLESKCFVA